MTSLTPRFHGNEISQQHRFKSDCLGSTCMKWSASGELSDLDMDHVRRRLAAVDSNLTPPPDPPA